MIPLLAFWLCVYLVMSFCLALLVARAIRKTSLPGSAPKGN